MKSLLDEYYRYDLHNTGYLERKKSITAESVIIYGVTQSGKTSLIKHYLLTQKKSTYLYIDCRDIRFDINELNASLEPFCKEQKISILVLDNYNAAITLFDIEQLILSCELLLELPYLTLHLNLLDYEEFLSFEQKYDSTALSHFLQLGGFPSMHRIPSEERALYLQKAFMHALNETELAILVQATKMTTQKVSAHNLYERLKLERKISKDKLYVHLQSLFDRRYLYGLEKFNHPSAVKKLYICDIAIKHALTLQKHFGRVFENLIFMELVKHDIECYYEEGIDFYLPSRSQIILAVPFENEHSLFKRVEVLEAFIITHDVQEIIVITMNLESTLSHPIAHIEMVPFTQWALGEE